MKKLLLLILILPIACLGFGPLKSKTRVDREELVKLQEQVNGLIEIQTKSGHVVKDIPRSRIPLDPDGKPYWDVVKTEPNRDIDKAKTGLSLFGPIGVGLATLFGAGATVRSLVDRKQKQAAIDKERKTGEKLTMAENILIAADVAIEAGTTDGTIRKELDNRLTKKQKEIKDKITESAVIAVKLAKAATG